MNSSGIACVAERVEGDLWKGGRGAGIIDRLALAKGHVKMGLR